MTTSGPLSHILTEGQQELSFSFASLPHKKESSDLASLSRSLKRIEQSNWPSQQDKRPNERNRMRRGKRAAYKRLTSLVSRRSVASRNKDGKTEGPLWFVSLLECLRKLISRRRVAQSISEHLNNGAAKVNTGHDGTKEKLSRLATLIAHSVSCCPPTSQEHSLFA